MVRVSEYSKSSTSRNESLVAISLEGDLSPCYRRGSYESSSGSSYESDQESEGSSRSLPNRNSLLHEELLEGSDRHIALTQSQEVTDSNLPLSEAKSNEDLCPEELKSSLVGNLRVAGRDANDSTMLRDALLEEGGRVDEEVVFHNGHTSVVRNGDEGRHCTTDCVEEHLPANVDTHGFRCSERLNGEKTVKEVMNSIDIEVYSVGFSGMITLCSCEEPPHVD